MKPTSDNRARRFWIITTIGVVIALVVVAIYWHPHGIPLWGRSEDQIRASILELTPLGTPIKEVKNCIKSRMHPDTFYYDKHGVPLPGRATVGGGPIIWDQWPLGGEHHGKVLVCEIGLNSLQTDIVGYWAFDDQGCLVDVFVCKGSIY